MAAMKPIPVDLQVKQCTIVNAPILGGTHRVIAVIMTARKFQSTAVFSLN
jgi:hypothetical protein